MAVTALALGGLNMDVGVTWGAMATVPIVLGVKVVMVVVVAAMVTGVEAEERVEETLERLGEETTNREGGSFSTPQTIRCITRSSISTFMTTYFLTVKVSTLKLTYEFTIGRAHYISRMAIKCLIHVFPCTVSLGTTRCGDRGKRRRSTHAFQGWIRLRWWAGSYRVG
jgi:hypothetical protein